MASWSVRTIGTWEKDDVHDDCERITAVVVGSPALPPGTEVLARAAPAPAEAAAAAVERVRPALVLVELTGPPDTAPAVITAVLARVPGAAVLAVAGAGPDHARVLDAVRAGATGVAAGTDPAELAAVARAAAAGRPAFTPGLAGVVLESVAAPAHAVPELSPRESEVLRLVVEGLTARQIAARLVLSPRTVENHVQRLLRKFDVPGRGALVRYAIEFGLA
ncbi:helix-turn-helix transcriptional regulator [Pseudonocardia spirodelae]|uniref:LuxR C-terminal-related transcriptional regulator n=1 Tax=Pseudonocardia spirodelae TaxID=3133431 RepID=A0ABU8T354_9PSEU